MQFALHGDDMTGVSSGAAGAGQKESQAGGTARNKATICIVNYKTPEFIKLCLRSIRKFTSYPYDVVVVDNDSGDASLEYLSSLEWIKVIERRSESNEPGGGYAHGAGLDMGLADCNSEFFVSMHSDTFVCRRNWLSELIGYFDESEDIACVGTGKIELTPRWREVLKKATDFRTFKRKLLREPDPAGKYRYYNRTICCIYRTSILKQEKLGFVTGREQGLTAGKKLYFELVDRGYRTVELPASVMCQYVVHLAHATQAVNPEEFALRRHTIAKYDRLSRKVLNRDIFRNLMEDASLDS